MDAREQWLSEQPVAVLQAHAQECGINTSGCVEKSDLVQRILRSEPTQLNQGDVSAGRASQRLQTQSEADLLADERLAMRLQAEEESLSRAGPQIGEVANEGSIAQLLGLAMSQGIAGRAGGLRQRQAANLPVGLPGAGGGASGTAGQTTEDGVPLDLLARLIGQVMANGDGGRNLAGAQALTELVNSLMPQQGLDAAAVESRTATMTFSGTADPGGSRASGDQSSSGVADEERKCMVCLEGFKDGEGLRILPCLHRYHVQCIDPWLAQNRHCPVCKHDVTQ